MVSLKIAYIVDAFPKLSETFILNEILELQKLGFDISIYSLMNCEEELIHPKAEDLVPKTHYFSDVKKRRTKKAHFFFFLSSPLRYLKTFIFSYKRKNFDTFQLFKYSIFWADELRKSGFSHIHSHFAGGSTEMAMILSMLTGIPYSFTAHAYDIFIAPRLLSEKTRDAKFIVVASEYNKKYILNLCPSLDANKIHKIHYGINVEEFRPSPQKLTKGKRFKILSVARLVEKKGIQYLIDACKIIGDRNLFPFECQIIGSGPEHPYLQGWILKNKLQEHITLLGNKTSDEVKMALEEADVFVLPCVIAENGDRDGVPNVLIEAMAAGVPVISTTVSGIPELVKEGAGFLVEPRDAEGLAKRILDVAHLDEEEKRKLVANARKVVEREFNLKKEVPRLAALFKS